MLRDDHLIFEQYKHHLKEQIAGFSQRKTYPSQTQTQSPDSQANSTSSQDNVNTAVNNDNLGTVNNKTAPAAVTLDKAALAKYFDEMQLPGLPGATVVEMINPEDEYDARMAQTVMSLIQKKIPATEFRNTLMNILEPVVTAATAQGLNPTQLMQRMQDNPIVMTRYLAQAAQQLLYGPGSVPPRADGLPQQDPLQNLVSRNTPVGFRR